MTVLLILSSLTAAAATQPLEVVVLPVCWRSACSLGPIDRWLPCEHLPDCAAKHEGTRHEPVHELPMSGTPLVFLHWGKTGAATVQAGLDSVSRAMVFSQV